jgi:hypothetical protein
MDAASSHRDRGTDLHDAMLFDQSTLPPPPRMILPFGERPSTGRLDATSHSNSQNNDTRPRTAPSNARGSILEEQRILLEDGLKRDSGFITSTRTKSGTAPRQHNDGDAAAPAHSPSLPTPTIVVHDADSSHRLQTLERLISPFVRRRSHDTGREPPPKEAEPQRPTTGHSRVKSFHGIETDIPTGELHEFTSENIDFSKRGSLLFGGKKMGQLIAAQGNAPIENVAEPSIEETSEDAAAVALPRSPVSPMSATWPTSPRSPTSPTSPISPHMDSPAQFTDTGAATEPTSPTIEVEKKQGLVSGRRTPSVHMLQAAIAGGRVLSAEEISFSMRVRSMYEHGDENAADWTKSPFEDTSRTASPELDRNTPDLPTSDEGLVVGKKRETTVFFAGRNPDEIRASYTKEAHETAGGMEDWEDLKGADVDRFGFISPSRVLSHDSGVHHHTNNSIGLHRVATGLRLVSDAPRRERSRLRRKGSIARSSRSAPPGKDSSAGSIRSIKSNRTGSIRSGRFRSRDRRAMDEASNMLTLPPGLADIAEDQDYDNNKTLDRAYRKEWSRNEKWLQMARKRSDSRGGGMSFDFDTSDSKLISRTWKGIPDRWRAAAWHSFLSASARRRGPHTSDEELILNFHRLQELNCADDVQIDVDVPRTISMHIMFRKRYRGGQRLLFRVLHAIALYCPDTGYVQGMASLAATLLCYFDEERAFVMLVRLWQLRGLEQLFRSGFDGLMAALQEFEDQWLRGGDVATRLEELGISSTAYGTRWYLTLFNMSVPFPAQLRVWDVFMLLGDQPADAPAAARETFGGADLDVLHATSAALVDATRDIILDTDFEGAMKTLTSFIPVRDEDMLMRVAKAEWKMRKKRGVMG